ncbi:hypothetical protein A2U01_0101025, partial [Trifolium medium]|nr:hypothetical protein [Trifolium medium]
FRGWRASEAEELQKLEPSELLKTFQRLKASELGLPTRTNKNRDYIRNILLTEIVPRLN